MTLKSMRQEIERLEKHKEEVKEIYKIPLLTGELFLIYGLYNGDQMISFQREGVLNTRLIKFFEASKLLSAVTEKRPELKEVATVLRESPERLAMLAITVLVAEFERLRLLSGALQSDNDNLRKGLRA